MNELADSRTQRQALLGYALSVTNRALGMRLFGSPREVVDELQSRKLDIGAVLDHPETEIGASEVLKSLPHLSLSGGPHAEILLELLDAVQAPGSKLLIALLDQNPAALTSDTAGAALLAAVSSSRVDLVEILLRRGAQVDAAADFGMTALHWAAALGDAAAVEALLVAGADGRRKTWFYITAYELGALNKFEAVARRIAGRHGDSPKAFSLDLVIGRMKAERLLPHRLH